MRGSLGQHESAPPKRHLDRFRPVQPFCTGLTPLTNKDCRHTAGHARYVRGNSPHLALLGVRAMLAQCRERHGDRVTLWWCRSRWSEPARRCVRQRSAASRHRASADRRDGAPGRPTVRHFQTAARLSRMRQQNPRKVGTGNALFTSSR